MSRERFNKEVGRRIAEARAKKDIRAEKLAEGAGITTQSLSNIEHGHRAFVTPTLYGICQTLGVSADEVLGLKKRAPANDILIHLQKLKPREIALVERFIRDLVETYHT